MNTPGDAGARPETESEQTDGGDPLTVAVFRPDTERLERALTLLGGLGVEAGARAGLSHTVVDAIGEPTADRVQAADVEVTVVPGEASFEALARAVVSRL